jgi:hypothetical protein
MILFIKNCKLFQNLKKPESRGFSNFDIFSQNSELILLWFQNFKNLKLGVVNIIKYSYNIGQYFKWSFLKERLHMDIFICLFI